MADILSRVAASFFTTPIPKWSYMDSRIGIIDSRYWDPEWRAQYGGSYNTLLKVLTYVYGHPQVAINRASGESFMWGYGGGPALDALRPFENLSASRVADKIRRLFNRLRNPNQFAQAIMDPVEQMEAPAEG